MGFKFKLGDTVRVLKGEYDGYVSNVVRYHTNLGKRYYVLSGCSYAFLESELKLVETGFSETKRKPIVIYQNGNEVIALDKETGCKGVAKCSPLDNFSFMVGAKLAFERISVSSGDRVKVIDPSLAYNNYDIWSGLNNYNGNFVNGKLPNRDKLYDVINIGKHDRFDMELALIQDPDTTQVFIVDMRGLRKVV